MLLLAPATSSTSHTLRALRRSFHLCDKPFSRRVRAPTCRPLSSVQPSLAQDDAPRGSSSSEHQLFRLLLPNERELLEEQQHLTSLARNLANQVGGGVDNVLTQSSNFLQQLQLQASFSVVVAGEFNAGKSTLINALIGRKLLECGALPTTDAVTIVAAEDKDDTSKSSSTTIGATTPLPLGVVMHTVSDQPLLQDLTLVDTPGTNSAWIDHTERTVRLLPAADWILFVTSADRPFSDSEKQLLRNIQAYRKSIVIVVNKMDILDATGGNHGAEAKQEIVDFVSDHASELLGARPIVLPVSSRDALAAKMMERSTPLNGSASLNGQEGENNSSISIEQSSLWKRSNFGSIETFLRDSLTKQAKLQSKLTNPIGVVEGVMTQCLSQLSEQQTELKADVATLNLLQSQFGGWKKELSVEMDQCRHSMTDMVKQEGQRCDTLLNRMSMYDFFAWTLNDLARLEQEWEQTKRKTSAHRHHDSLDKDLLDLVHEISDSIATRGRAQGQAVIEYLGKRPAVQNNNLVGSVTAASRFEETRKHLIERLSKSVQDSVVSSEVEAHQKNVMFSSLKQSAVGSLLLGVGSIAFGAGTMVGLLDPLSGFLMASSSLAGSGAARVLSTSRISNQFRADWTDRAVDLDNALEAVCGKEMERVNRRIMGGVAPYTRFVETETERTNQLKEECENVISASRGLRNKIARLR